MFEYARLAIEELDFDGLRFDFVKGYGAWMIGLLAKYRYQKKDGREFTPFVVGEYWSDPKGIDHWLDQVRIGSSAMAWAERGELSLNPDGYLLVTQHFRPLPYGYPRGFLRRCLPV